MAEHIADPTRIHHQWDLDLEPVLEIESGDTVHFDIKVAADGQIWPGATFEETRLDFDTMYNMCGPVHVRDAQPGDMLQIDILSLEAGDWGWAAFLPGIGLLPDEFPEGYVRTFELTEGKTIRFADGIHIPKRPFLGTMGTHPGTPGRQLPFPPHGGGGNMDNRHLTQGTSLWLPVFVDGGHFSAGDPHAAQGDGEVCVTAIECPMKASLRFTLHKNRTTVPSFNVPAESVDRKDDGGYYGTMGIDPDLMECSRIAVRAMIDRLVSEYSMTPEDAYMLCSVAGDLRILEVVDAGVWNVAMTLPHSIFTNR